MNETIGLLKVDVERAIGFKIKTTTEAKAFHQLLVEKTNSTVSLSTIRRFWGLIPQRKPNQHTLNELSKFIQYQSFYHYSKNKSQFATWFDVMEIHKLKFKKKLKTEDFDLIERHYNIHGSTLFVMNLIEVAIFNKNWPYVFDLFNPRKLNIIENKGVISNFTAKLANLTLLFLKHLPEHEFNTAVNQLILNKNFKNYCVYVFVDVINLNNFYGDILHNIKNTNVDVQENTFLDLILGLRSFLCEKPIQRVSVSETDIKLFPEVLIGRYYGYLIIYNSIHSNEEAEELAWKQYLNKINSSNKKRDLLHEFVLHLLLIRQFDKLEYILENFHDDIFDYVHIHSYLDGFIFNLIDVIISLKTKDKSRAKNIFSHLDIHKITDSSYCDYYLIFYYLVGFNFNQNTAHQKHCKDQYEKIADQSGFILFNEGYLKNYFK